MILTLIKRQPVTPTVESFWFNTNTSFTHKAGQFLRWMIEDAAPDDRGNSRFFSIASSPTEAGIMLATKFNPEGSSFKRRINSMKLGDTLKAVGPLGEFVLPDDENQPVVLVAGGIGVTPFRSMLKEMADRGSTRPTQLLFSARTEDELAFKNDVDMWSAAHPNIDITYLVGDRLLDANSVTSLGLAGKQIYLSGPKPMLEALKASLEQEHKVPEARIKTDYFPGYQEI